GRCPRLRQGAGTGRAAVRRGLKRDFWKKAWDFRTFRLSICQTSPSQSLIWVGLNACDSAFTSTRRPEHRISISTGYLKLKSKKFRPEPVRTAQAVTARGSRSALLYLGGS